MSEQTIVLDTPEAIEAYRLLVLRARLQLELRSGLRFRVATAPAVRKHLGSTTRSRRKLLAELEADLRERGVLR